jgi:anaerobic magnesium-protoporphyrin IX monomethyl ester cyclase
MSFQQKCNILIFERVIDLKMLFIYPDIGGNINFSPAIQILTACIKQDGNDAQLLHIHDKYGMPVDHETIFSKVKEINPDIIGVTATSFQYELANEIAGNLKVRGVKQPIILGGIHAIITPDDLDSSCFDAFSVGEADKSLVELLRRMKNGGDIYSVKGFNFKKDGGIIYNGPPEVVSNLDELPPKDYEIINVEKILMLRNKWLGTAFSRGCPYTCTFCMNHKLREQYKLSCGSRYYRCQSVDRAIGDILPIIEKYKGKIDVVDTDDDLLLSDKKWFSEFACRFESEIFKPYGIKYSLESRADLIDEETVIKLKKSGCELILIGFETGSEELRNLLLGKGISDEQLIKAFDLFNKHGLRSLAFAMIGIPGESADSINKSLALLRRLKPTLIRQAIFEPFAGTPLYDYCMEHKLFKGNKVSDNYYTASTITFKNLSSKELKLYQLLYPWYLNLNFVGKYEEKYKELINRYSEISEDELLLPEVKNSILVDDKLISDYFSQKGVQHFRYFENKTYYCLSD